MKRIIALIMAAVLLFGCLCGCGKSEEADDGSTVTLVVAIPWATQRDTNKVEGIINEKLKELLPNTQIKLMLDSAFAEKWTLWMATKKAIDVAHSGWETNLEAEIRQDTYLPLNDLVEKHAPNIKEMEVKYFYCYDNAKMNGELYAVPNVQTYTRETTQLSLNAEKYGEKITAVSFKSDKSTRELYEVIDECLLDSEKNGEDMKSKVNTTMLYELAKRGYHFIGGSNSNICYDNSDSGKILDFYTTESFKLFCEYAKKWGDRGWVSKDILTKSNTLGVIATEGFRYGEDPVTHRYQANSPVEYNFQRINLDNPENDILVDFFGQNSSYWSIPFTSKNPVRAIKFIDLLNSKEGAEISNLLAFGIEGEHYEVLDKEKGNIKAFEYNGQGTTSSSYGIPSWMCGNMMLMYNVYPYDNTIKEYAENYYNDRIPNMKKHVLYGVGFSDENVKLKMNAIVKNNTEYAPSIYCGVADDAQGAYNELTQKNKAAGIDEVIAEFQKQADNYMKK